MVLLQFDGVYLIDNIREFVEVENIHEDCLIDSWLWTQNKCKVDAELPATREEQNWHSGWLQFLRKFPDEYSLIDNFSAIMGV